MSNFRLHLLVILVFCVLEISTASVLKYQSSGQVPGVVPMIKRELPGLSRFFADSTLLKSNFTRFRRTETLDSSQQRLLISEKLYDRDYSLPIAVDLDYYVEERLKSDKDDLWRKTALKFLTQTRTTGPGGIELNIPVRIKSKAFQRIFGGDKVGLRVTGNISFELAGRAEKREGSAVSSVQERGNFSPRFKQTQQFQVEGKVGDKVSVKVDQNSEATFDLENTLKLTYTGDEDEIVQSIEAGNVSLALPSTNYVSASSKHQGLFGLKTRMQVGNLGFTGIASLQRGEKQKLQKTGESAENTFRIKDIEYIRDRFFFVDDVYAEHFESGYNPKTLRWEVFEGGAYRIDQLDVWIMARPEDQDTRQAWASLEPEIDRNVDQNELIPIPGQRAQSFFKRLDPNDYQYDEYRGFFWIKQNLSDQDILAVAYSTEGGIKEGDLFTEVSDSAATIFLKLIRPQSSKPEYPTWELSMRNVYNLGAAQISSDGFDLKILFTKEGSDVDVQPVGEAKPFVYLLGLDRLDEQGSFIEGGDKKIDVNNGNFFDLANGYLIFPSLSPFAPEDNSEFKIDPSLNVNIYNIKDRTQELQAHKFDIEVTTSSVSSTFNLGFNVLEGSEIVRLNGRELIKDQDYVIDYWGGTLQILAEEARRSDANVEIEYERGSLFQLDKKTLLGGRLEYTFGERGFIGLTGLYLNKTTLDQRVRLGQEPVKNFIWDINAAMDFKPNIITKLLDALPILETSADSRLRFEAEYAQVNPNPNTFNEDGLGEKKGVAYIDDFEGSERTTPLGITYRTWAPASTPARFSIPRLNINYDIPLKDESLMYQMDGSRVRMYWYNPFNQVAINDIWPNKDVNAQTGTTTNVLVMEWQNESIPVNRAWGGIMRSTISFPDQNKTKFLELWVKGDVGQINIDIGRISEDFYVRENTTTFQSRRSLGNLNTEDFNLNGLLEDDEDVGLDGVPTGHPNDDPWDDWLAPQETTPPFIQINGTENNGSARGAKYPDTEDLDGDGGLNQTNEYFTYSFSLADSVHPYIKGSTVKGWKLYRIPIRNYDPQFVVGKPDTNFREIFFSRLWINDLPQDNQLHRVQIATFDFVGNEWEEIGVAANDLSPFIKDDSLFSISVYNSEENVDEVEGGPEPYQSPPNVTGIIDRITRAKSKEQSLVLQLGRLEVGAQAEAMKQLFEKINLINYANLRIFVHGDRTLPELESPLEFFVRFGPTEAIYYEVGSTVYPHWDERNHLDVVLDDLAKTRQDEFATGDTLNTKYPVYYRTEPENPEKYFKVVGEPNLRNINFIIIGARNIGEFTLENLEIWLDEFRVTNVERDKGTAMRILSDLQMADVANFRVQFEVTDADFRRIEDQFGTGNTLERQQYRFGIKVDKFLPSSWGFNIPISGGLVKSKSIPKYFYNTDQLTDYKSEGFGEMIKQIFGLNELDPELEKDSRIQESKSLGATFQRRGTARAPWYLKYSIDMITLDADWNEKHASDERNLLNDDKTLSAQFQLNVPFGTQNSVKPFSWLGNGPIVRKLANQEIFYTPSSLGFNVGIRDNETKRQARLETNPTSTIQTTSTRRVNMTYKLFPSLTSTISRDHQADAFLKGYRAKDLINSIFTELDFGIDKVINQNFSVTYNPQIFQWMTQNLKYTSGFNYNYSNVNTNEKSSRLQVTKQIAVNIQPTMLANSIYNPAKRKVLRQAPQSSSNTGTSSRGGPRSRSSSQRNMEIDRDTKQDEKKTTDLEVKPPVSSEGSQERVQLENITNRTSKTQPDSNAQTQPEEKKKKIILPSLRYLNPLLIVWKVFDSWKSVNVDYRIQDSYNYFNIETLPTLNHQFGFDPEPGVDEDTTFNKIPRLPGIRNGKNVSGGLTFDIVKNLSSTFKYNYNKDLSQNNQQRTETIASTYFFTGEDPEANQKFWHEFVPDWQLRLTGLERIKILQKLPYFTKIIKTLSLEHARSGKFNENNRYDEIGIKSRDNWGYSNSYSPLFGMTINTPFGMNGNIRYTKSSVFSFNTTGAANKSLRSGFDITMSFRKTGGFNLPLPFLKNKKLKNEMQFNLSLNTSSDIAFSKRSGSDKFEEQTKNRSFKAKPSVTYRFSPKVNGSMFFEQSISENKRTGTYSYFEFGVNVNIAIR